MLKISGIKFKISPGNLHVYTKEELLDYILDKLINVYNAKGVSNLKLVKKSIDARHSNVSYILSASFCADNEDKLINIPGITKFNIQPNILSNIKSTKKDVSVIGMGPAGLFCSLVLAESGMNVTLIERGQKVEDRVKTVEGFFKGEALNPESNIQFGEGGAGTFSDGKLSTGVNSPYINFIYETFVRFGANEDILYDAYPHIGTDILRKVIINLRNYLISLGVKILYNTKLINFDSNYIYLESSKSISKLKYEKLVLATGHSADDIYKLLKIKRAHLEPKNFAVGLRIEHLASDINKSMYHGFYPNLPAANYKLVTHLDSGRTVYTFCMCPGGEVVNASSSARELVINGMSYNKRDDINSNSALLVNVEVNDYYHNDVLDGVKFQKELEQNAYELHNGLVPVERLEDFLNNNKILTIGKVTPSIKTGYQLSNLEDCLPEFVSKSIKEALPLMGKKIKGFDDKDSILSAIESRSSAPVRIVRKEDLSTNLSNVYAAGEGSGYSGGITTSAADGIKIALKIIEESNKNE